MHSLWLALLACVLIFQDAYLVPPTVTGAELGTWWNEIRVEVCDGAWAAVVVSGRIYEDVQGEQREVRAWKEIVRTRLTVTVEGAK